MKVSAIAATAALALSTAFTSISFAQTPTPAPATPPPAMTAPAPTASVTGTKSMNHLYKQNVYSPADEKIGSVNDLLLSSEGQVTSAVIGVGGFLGIGEKDVAVPLSALKQTVKDGKPYLVMDTTKDAMKAASGIRYDSTNMVWAPAAQ